MACPDNQIFSTCNCQRTCARNDISVCLATCNTSGCICRPGFVLNENIGLCIPPLDCPCMLFLMYYRMLFAFYYEKIEKKCIFFFQKYNGMTMEILYIIYHG